MGSPAAVKRYLKHFPSNMTELYTYFMHIFYKLLRFPKERHRKGQSDVPKCSWLDALTFDHLNKVRARTRTLERVCIKRAYLYIELPFFGHPVVYSEQPAPAHWFRCVFFLFSKKKVLSGPIPNSL